MARLGGVPFDERLTFQPLTPQEFEVAVLSDDGELDCEDGTKYEKRSAHIADRRK